MFRVGDWVFTRSGYVAAEPYCEWVLAKLIHEDDSNIPYCVVLASDPNREMAWRHADRVRPPETDEEWAAIAAHVLMEGSE